MKRLTGLKHNTINGHGGKQADERNWKNNPYPESGIPPRNFRQSDLRGGPRPAGNARTSMSQETGSILSWDDSTSARNGRVMSTRSGAPTVATNPDTINSEAAHSKTGTAHTGGGGLSSRDGRGNSTFSSPQHSQESLTTTLTTLQSTAPSGILAPAATAAAPAGNPAPAAPNYNVTYASHLPQLYTYSSAVSNNMLTDNASVLTLASSSKRRRRNSLDTDASIRALAPSSLFGNSRESLPLSLLSANVDAAAYYPPGRAPPPAAGIAGAERASVYSSSGVAAAVGNSERNSYYAGKQGLDGASVRSGLLGHGKADSVSGSITGLAGGATSPLASPREASLHGRTSRRNSGWQEHEELSCEEEEDEDEAVRVKSGAGENVDPKTGK
jgi:hypothetical protein